MIKIKVQAKKLNLEQLNTTVSDVYYETANKKLHRLLSRIADRFKVRVRTGHLASLFNLYGDGPLFNPIQALNMRHLGGDKKFSSGGSFSSKKKGKEWVRNFAHALETTRGAPVSPNDSFLAHAFIYKGKSDFSSALKDIASVSGKNKFAFGKGHNKIILTVDGKEQELMRVVKALISKHLFKEFSIELSDKEDLVYACKL